MARPRTVSDADLLAACAEVIGRHGPGFTLAQVATEAGVAVGTVAGRFGSKHGLLVALMDGATATLEESMRAVVDAHDDPVDALRQALLVMTGGIEDPETAVQHLAQLGADLADPELRARFSVQRATVRAMLGRLVEAAELPFAPPAPQAAAVLAALVQGLQQDWSLAPEGDPRDRLLRDVDTVLSAWQGSAR